MKTTVSLDGLKFIPGATAKRTSAVRVPGKIKRIHRLRKTLRLNERCFVILKITFRFSWFFFSTRSMCDGRRCPVFNTVVVYNHDNAAFSQTSIVHKTWVTAYGRGEVDVLSPIPGCGRQTFFMRNPSFVRHVNTYSILVNQ